MTLNDTLSFELCAYIDITGWMSLLHSGHFKRNLIQVWGLFVNSVEF